jgi:hypothetical protein
LEFEKCVASAKQHSGTLATTEDEELEVVVGEIQLAIEEEVSCQLVPHDPPCAYIIVCAHNFF